MAWGPDLARQVVEDFREAARLRGTMSAPEAPVTHHTASDVLRLPTPAGPRRIVSRS